MQHCDHRCPWCAQHFWAWLKARMKSAEREAGRSGAGSFAEAAATSIRAPATFDPAARAREKAEARAADLAADKPIEASFSFPDARIRFSADR